MSNNSLNLADNKLNFESDQKGQEKVFKKSSKFLLPITIALLSKPNVSSGNTPGSNPEKGTNKMEMPTSPTSSKPLDNNKTFYLGDDPENLIDKEEMTIKFIKDNVFINETSLKSFDITHVKDDEYSLFYELENGVKLKVTLMCSYSGNNIYINTVDVLGQKHIQEEQLYLVGMPENQKTVEINIKEDPNSQIKLIKSKEKNNTLTNPVRFENNPKFENTQLADLNKFILGNEIFEKGNSYYKEVFSVVNGMHVKICNVYYKKNGNIDVEQTKAELKDIKILGVDVHLIINSTESNGQTNIDISLDPESKKAVEDRLAEDRAALTNLLNNPDFASDQDFPGLNKVDGKHSINTTIIKRYDIENRIYLLGIGNTVHILGKMSGEGESLKASLVDHYGNSIENQRTNINGHGYTISIGDKLKIHEIKVSKNISENILPHYTGNSTISNILNNSSNNTLLTGNSTETYDAKGNLLIKLPTTVIDGKTEIAETYSVDLNVLDFYNHYPKFKATTDQIKALSNKLGLTELDIKAAIETQLQKKGIELKLPNTVRVCNGGTNDVFYCNLNGKLPNIEIDEYQKLVESVKVILEDILSKLGKIKQVQEGGVKKRYPDGRIVDMSKYAAGQSGGNDVAILYSEKMAIIKGERGSKDVQIVWDIDGRTPIILLRNMKNNNLKSKEEIFIGGTEYKPLNVDSNGGAVLGVKLKKE